MSKRNDKKRLAFYARLEKLEEVAQCIKKLQEIATSLQRDFDYLFGKDYKKMTELR